jgi:hypothetical protein
LEINSGRWPVGIILRLYPGADDRSSVCVSEQSAPVGTGGAGCGPDTQSDSQAIGSQGGDQPETSAVLGLRAG